jgi:hypothetical protein
MGPTLGRPAPLKNPERRNRALPPSQQSARPALADWGFEPLPIDGVYPLNRNRVLKLRGLADCAVAMVGGQVAPCAAQGVVKSGTVRS